MNKLFRKARTTLHSGQISNWKIDCDSLFFEDWETCAWLIHQRCEFGRVVGIPSGGLRLASKLERFVDPTKQGLLIVDDVITTGDSFREFAATVEGPYAGAALFGRGDPAMYPSWVTPIFQATPWFTSL